MDAVSGWTFQPKARSNCPTVSAWALEQKQPARPELRHGVGRPLFRLHRRVDRVKAHGLPLVVDGNGGRAVDAYDRDVPYRLHRILLHRSGGAAAGDAERQNDRTYTNPFRAHIPELLRFVLFFKRAQGAAADGSIGYFCPD